jgi:tetratricopeptide (TPR) repeat protein
VHFDRAKRVGSVEPDVWYICGSAAAKNGDWPSAMADWREALVRSPLRLAAIVRATAGRVSPEEFRARALPDDPALWFAAAHELFSNDAAPGRTDWMRAIDVRCSRAEPETAPGLIAWGSALEELRDGPRAIRVWRRAAERFPDGVVVRDRLARRLEAEELYEEALSELEWLTARQPGNSEFGHRLTGAKHALKLKAEIDGR